MISLFYILVCVFYYLMISVLAAIVLIAISEIESFHWINSWIDILAVFWIISLPIILLCWLSFIVFYLVLSLYFKITMYFLNKK